MLQLIIKFVIQNALKSAGPVLAANGIANSQQWQTVCGVIAAAIGWIWHWHEAHAAAVASGAIKPASLPPGATLPDAGAKAAALIALLVLPVAMFTGCGGLPKDVAHVYTISGDGTSMGITQNPATQLYELGLKRIHTHLTIVPIVFQTNAAGTITAVIPDTVVSDEINGRNSIFGGAGGTITVATGTNAVQTMLGGGHVPINEGSGTNLPK